MTNSTSIGTRLWPYMFIPPILGFLAPPVGYFLVYTTVIGIPPALALREILVGQVGGANFLFMEIFSALPFVGLSAALTFFHGLPRRRLYLMLIFGFMGAAPLCAQTYTWFFYPGFESSMNAMAILMNLIFSSVTTAIGLLIGVGISHFPFINRVLGPEDAHAYKHSVILLPTIFAGLIVICMNYYAMTVSPSQRDMWMGRRYSQFGQDVDKRHDHKTSIKFFKSACQLGNDNGCGWLTSAAAKMDDANGKPLYQMACDHSYWDACNDLAMIEQERGDKEKARSLFQKACDKRMMPACSNLGVTYFLARKYKEAEQLSKLACDNKNAFGCYTLGSLYDRQGDRKKGIAHYQLACDYGQANGCTAVKELQAKKK